MSHGSESREEHEDRLAQSRSGYNITLIQVLFGVVLAFGISTQTPGGSEILLDPRGNTVGFLALVTVELAGIMSWIGWHHVMAAHPFTKSFRDRLRLWLDISIVSLYGILILEAQQIAGAPTNSIRTFLVLNMLVFVIYVLWEVVLGPFRRDRQCTVRFFVNLFFGALSIALVLSYSSAGICRNELFLSLMLGAILLYRVVQDVVHSAVQDDTR